LDDIYELAETDAVRSVIDSQEMHKRFNRDVGKYLRVLHTKCPQGRKSRAWEILLRDWEAEDSPIGEGDIATLREALGITPLVEDRSSMEFVWIPPGSFDMGSPGDETGHDSNESPIHKVTLTKGFWLGRTPVTERQYYNVMRKPMPRRSRCPVTNVSWNHAMDFCERLEKRTSHRFRLPTEAEWEYACRAFATGRFNIGDSDGDVDRAGWYSGNSRVKTSSVHQKEQNAWGLFDMHGNVCEWCSDWYAQDYYDRKIEIDPQGPDKGDDRVLRGGSWQDKAKHCRCAARGYLRPLAPRLPPGFRVVREE